MSEGEDAASARRRTVVTDYRNKLLNCRELETRVRTARENLKKAKKDYDKKEDDLKSLQSVGQIICEVLRPLDTERFIVKASRGPRYVVGCRSKVDKEKLTAGTRVVLDMTTLTITRTLPSEAILSCAGSEVVMQIEIQCFLDNKISGDIYVTIKTAILTLWSEHDQVTSSLLA